MTKFKIGDVIRLTKESQKLNRLPDMDYIISDILPDNNIYPIKIDVSQFKGKECYEYLNEKEIEL
jgi:hypothetical protein